jgi:hypothetical protein
MAGCHPCHGPKRCCFMVCGLNPVLRAVLTSSSLSGCEIFQPNRPIADAASSAAPSQARCSRASRAARPRIRRVSADAREHLHREVLVRHPALYFEVHRVRLRVQRHDYRICLERVRPDSRPRYMHRRRVRHHAVSLTSRIIASKSHFGATGDENAVTK